MRTVMDNSQNQALFQLFSCVIISMLICWMASPTNAATFYVTPTGAGIQDGSDWANAAPGTDLQLMINGAVANDEVWVACGTYVPTNTTDRTIAFAMRNGVAIYGSFLGNENLLSERDLSCGPCSILSGEIGAAGNADNSYKVIYNQMLDNTAILDGFTIRDGNDDRTPTSAGNGLGGGLYNHGFNPGGFCHPVIRNCVFTNNFASWGGGAFNNGYNNGNTQPTYINCIFNQNHAYIEAGGMDSYGVGGNASPTVINTVFYANTAATNVGAMYAWGGNAGGNSAPVLINCAFVNNSALNGYAGAFIADNLDENGITSSGACTVTLQNCIVWNNTSTSGPDQFYIRGTGAQVIATYSDIDMTNQPGPHSISGAGTGNLSQNPLFLDMADADGLDNCWLTADDGLQLQAISPCLDAGDNTSTYPTDILGNARISGTTVDMGLYEMQQPLPVEILSFMAEKVDEAVRISWMELAEGDRALFTVERSRDGLTFGVLQALNSKSGIEGVATYQIWDENPLPGLSYYRLKQTDINGAVAYSNITSVLFKTVQKFSVYPNPVVERLFVEGTENEISHLAVFNAVGQKLFGAEKLIQSGPRRYVLDMQFLPSGLYFVKTRLEIVKVYKQPVY